MDVQDFKKILDLTPYTYTDVVDEEFTEEIFTIDINRAYSLEIYFIKVKYFKRCVHALSFDYAYLYFKGGKVRLSEANFRQLEIRLRTVLLPRLKKKETPSGEA